MSKDGFNIKRVNDKPDALYIVEKTDKVVISVAAFDWDWTFLKRTVIRKEQAEVHVRLHDHLWWHRMCVEAIEDMKLHIRIDHLHVANYIGDHDPTPEHIEQLKQEYSKRGANSIQIHDGYSMPSSQLPIEEEPST